MKGAIRVTMKTSKPGVVVTMNLGMAATRTTTVATATVRSTCSASMT